MRSLFSVLLLATALLLNGTVAQAEAVTQTTASQQSQPQLLGSQACAACHSELFETFSSSSHHLASHTETADAYYGPLEPGENILDIASEKQLFTMTRHNDTVRVTEASRETPNKPVHTQDIELIVGNRHSLSFLYWFEDQLLRMPVATFTGDWAADPQRRRDELTFAIDDRLPPGCLYCHATQANFTTGKAETLSISQSHTTFHYDKDTLFLGAGCERCHGAGSEHAVQMATNPKADDKKIIRLGNKSDAQISNVCAQCHAGTIPTKLDNNHHSPLEPVDNYMNISKRAYASVHANQSLLLEDSQCFKQAQGPGCLTCHDPHSHKNDSREAQTAVCANCHETPHDDWKAPAFVADQCLACHMPRQNWPVRFQLNDGKREAAAITNHRIGIYKEGKKLLEDFRNEKKTQ